MVREGGKSMNKVVLMGRLTRDPEIKYTTGQDSKAVAKYTLAVDRRYARRDEPSSQTADFISCTAFGKAAEFAEKYFNKGMKIAISGHIQTGSYTNREGQRIYTTDVIIEEQEFAESKRQDGHTGSGAGSDARQQPDEDGFINIPDGIEEELPFG